MTFKIEDVGLVALRKQYNEVRKTFEHDEYGAKSGLHCKNDPDDPMCHLLNKMEARVVEEESLMAADKKMVHDEMSKLESYTCDCTFNDWVNDWSECSVTCEHGEKKETRSIKWNSRNGGKNCSDDDSTRTEECYQGCCRKCHHDSRTLSAHIKSLLGGEPSKVIKRSP